MDAAEDDSLATMWSPWAVHNEEEDEEDTRELRIIPDISVVLITADTANSTLAGSRVRCEPPERPAWPADKVPLDETPPDEAPSEEVPPAEAFPPPLEAPPPFNLSSCLRCISNSSSWWLWKLSKSVVDDVPEDGAPLAGGGGFSAWVPPDASCRCSVLAEVVGVLEVGPPPLQPGPLGPPALLRCCGRKCNLHGQCQALHVTSGRPQTSWHTHGLAPDEPVLARRPREGPMGGLREATDVSPRASGELSGAAPKPS